MIVFISTQLNGTNNIQQVLDWANTQSDIYFDFETSGLDPYLSKPILLAVGNEDIQYVIDCRNTDKEFIKQLFYQNKDKLWIAHNAKFDAKFVAVHYKVYLRNLYCTMIASQVIYNGCSFSHSLNEILIRHFGIKLDKSIRKNFQNLKDTDAITDEEVIYNATDIIHLPKLKKKQKEVCPSKELWNYITNVECKLIRVFVRAEVIGIGLNIEGWKDIAIKNTKLLDKIVQNFKEFLKLDNSISNILKEAFDKNKKKQKKRKLKAYQMSINWENPEEILPVKTPEDLILEDLDKDSPKQLKLLFNRLGIQVENTKEETLQNWILDNFEHKYKPLLEYLLKIRKVSKSVSTYGMSFLKHINPITGKIHGNFNQTKTDTLRVSMDEPNLQQIPALNIFRNNFIAEKGYKFAIIDYSQQEIKIAASISREPVLLAPGLDFHSYLAEPSYNLIYKELNKIPPHGKFTSDKLELNEDKTITINKHKNVYLRTEHKSLLFAKFYLAGAKRFMQVLNIPKDTAYKVFNLMGKNLPMLEKFQKELLKKVRRTLTVYANNIDNVKKFFHDFQTGKIEEYKMDKEAANFPIQHTGAAQKKRSWVAIDEFFYDNNYYDKYPNLSLLIDIHDEGLFQLPDNEEFDYLANKCKQIMEETGQIYLIPEVKCEAEMQVDYFWKK